MSNENKTLEDNQTNPEPAVEPQAEGSVISNLEDLQTNPTPTSSDNLENPLETAASIEPEEDVMSAIVTTLQAEISNLRQLLEEQTQKAEQSKKQYWLTAADFENFRKRTEREKEELEKRGKRQTITELLSVVDNFERARTQIKPTTEGETGIHKSYQGVYKNLVDGLKKLGVSAMRPEGEPFDPQYHEAMLREPTDQYPEGTVIEQLVRGYILGDQVLRHAMVKVATALETPTITENTEQDSTE